LSLASYGEHTVLNCIHLGMFVVLERDEIGVESARLKKPLSEILDLREMIAEEVIERVLEIARNRFEHERLHYWNDSGEVEGMYDWLEVSRVQGHGSNDVSEVEKELNWELESQKEPCEDRAHLCYLV